jgi:hypothetical protein
VSFEAAMFTTAGINRRHQWGKKNGVLSQLDKSVRNPGERGSYESGRATATILKRDGIIPQPCFGLQQFHMRKSKGMSCVEAFSGNPPARSVVESYGTSGTSVSHLGTVPK